MGAGKLVAVSDAGPIIHLEEINCLPLLNIFEALHLPDAVWSETIGVGRVSVEHIGTLGNIRRHSLSQPDIAQFVIDNQITDLHTGERECLYLCNQSGVSTLLTDDLAVRTVAKQRNLTPIGSLGVIVKAYKIGNITLALAEKYITELYTTSTLFVTKAIVDIALQQLKTRSG